MNKQKTPIWFWIFSIPYLLIAILGLFQIYSILTLEIPEPLWIKLAYIVGILGNFIGAVLLVLRKERAKLPLIISIIGFLIHRFWIFAFSNISNTLEPIAPFTLFLPIVLSLFAILLIIKGKKESWIMR